MTDDSFYNTIHLAGKELDEAQQNALTQEQRILRWFVRQGRYYHCGPSMVHDAVFDKDIPLTSVRRAITSLTRRGDLVKSYALVMGTYGKPEHLWTVAAKWDAMRPYQGELL